MFGRTSRLLVMSLVAVACGSSPRPTAVPAPSARAAEEPSAMCPDNEIQEREVLAIALDEGERLLKARLNVDDGRPRASLVERDGRDWLAHVTFLRVSDTIAAVRVDACTGAIRSSEIGGGI